MAMEANWVFLVISVGLLLPILIGVGVSFPQFLKMIQWHWIRLRMTWLCGKRNFMLQSVISDFRERIAQQCLSIMVLVHILVLVYIQLCIACSWPIWISEATGWTILASSILLQSSLFFPRFMQRSFTLDLWFIIVTILAASHLSPWHSATEEVLQTSLPLILMLFLRMPALLMCNRISFLFLGNVIFLGLVLLREPTSADSVSLWVELMIFITTFALGLAIQSVLVHCAQMKINSDDTKENCVTQQTLLRFVCDAVVTMDDEGFLVNHSPNLAAMLSLEDDLEGIKLTDLMTAFEAERALALLDAFQEAEASTQQRLVNAFHTRLVDKYGEKIGTEVLVVKHMSSAGEQYVVGLREFNDDFGGQSVGHSEALSNRDDEPSTVHRNSLVSMSTLHSEASLQSQGSVMPSTCRQMMLLVDVSNSKVCAASAGLQEAVGMMVQDLFPSPSTIQLLKRLQKDADSAQANGEPLSLTLFSFAEMPMRLDGRGGVISSDLFVTIQTSPKLARQPRSQFAVNVLHHSSGTSHVLISAKIRFGSMVSRGSKMRPSVKGGKKAFYLKADDDSADIWPQSL